ncbi:MAG: hypothetical protein ACI4SO_04725, partial [Muribaculaceae bacterium]
IIILVVPAPPSGYRVIALELRQRRIEPDVSTERLRSNEFRVCWRSLSLTHSLGDTSGAFLFAVKRAKVVDYLSTIASTGICQS